MEKIKYDIVLITSRWQKEILKYRNIQLPYNLLILASYLESKGFKTKINDAIINENYLEGVKEAKFVGISVMTSQVPFALKIAK